MDLASRSGVGYLISVVWVSVRGATEHDMAQLGSTAHRYSTPTAAGSNRRRRASVTMFSADLSPPLLPIEVTRYRSRRHQRGTPFVIGDLSALPGQSGAGCRSELSIRRSTHHITDGDIPSARPQERGRRSKARRQPWRPQRVHIGSTWYARRYLVPSDGAAARYIALDPSEGQRGPARASSLLHGDGCLISTCLSPSLAAPLIGFSCLCHLRGVTLW